MILSALKFADHEGCYRYMEETIVNIATQRDAISRRLLLKPNRIDRLFWNNHCYVSDAKVKSILDWFENPDLSYTMFDDVFLVMTNYCKLACEQRSWYTLKLLFFHPWYEYKSRPFPAFMFLSSHHHQHNNYNQSTLLSLNTAPINK